MRQGRDDCSGAEHEHYEDTPKNDAERALCAERGDRVKDANEVGGYICLAVQVRTVSEAKR